MCVLEAFFSVLDRSNINISTMNPGIGRVSQGSVNEAEPVWVIKKKDLLQWLDFT